MLYSSLFLMNINNIVFVENNIDLVKILLQCMLK